jgi:glycosyltransferase involved in cell wall biosynthesis
VPLADSFRPVTRPVLFTGDIFRQQPRGGISRYFLELLARLDRPYELVAGVHLSAELVGSGLPARSSLRLPAFRGAHRMAALINPRLDAAALATRRGVIVHPTYYRDPDDLPAREPVVVTVHDMTHERLPELFGERWWSAGDPARHKAALCRRADRVLCNSETTRRDVLELLGLPEGKVRLTLHASRDWSPIASVAIHELDRPFFLWVGERHAYKNFPRTLEAWASCREAADTKLLCVGGRPFSAAERAAIASFRVVDRLARRVLSNEELRWAYEHAEGLIYPSLWEGFGVPLIEAMALGCPVVTSDRPPLREVGGDQALYAEPTDVQSLRAALAECRVARRDEPALAMRRANAARFSWDACARQHEAVYKELD